MKPRKEVIVILLIGLCFAFMGIFSPVTVQAADVKDPILTGTNILLGELVAVMKEKYPKTRFIYNGKPAGTISGNQDSAAAEADAMIIATGH
jgi:hypothetical protein